MENIRRLCIKTIFVLLFISLTGTAWAIPVAEITYIETYLESGYWRYDYTVHNKSDLGSGNDIWNFTLNFGLEFNTPPLYPDGWLDASYADYGTFYAEIGKEILPGSFSDGFSFQFDSKLGNFPFEVIFTDPLSYDYPIIYGTTAPVPEPATILLLVTGMLGMGIFGRKKLRN